MAATAIAEKLIFRWARRALMAEAYVCEQQKCESTHIIDADLMP